MYVDGKDIVITDIIYIQGAEDDFDIIECATNEGNLDKIGCPNSISATGCDVVKETLYDDNGEVIAEFCTDSYVVGCFLLEEILKYNPGLKEDMEKYSHAFAIIRDFKGTVTFSIQEEDYYQEKLPILNIIGKGNINFHSDYSPEDLSESTNY